MTSKNQKIGLGGSCHWCTEAIFLSLSGVTKVEQGWISSFDAEHWLSEGVIVHFNQDIISLKDLIEVHLHTHSCTANHSMRDKYRSAVYGFSRKQAEEVTQTISQFQLDFNNKIITKALLFNAFEPSREEIQDYYYKNPDKPFCQNIITPKLKILLNKFKNSVDIDKMSVGFDGNKSC